jgi:hypothetical protein
MEGTMTAVAEQRNVALQTIFSFFLGLMVVALVGVGTNTLLPSPSEKYDQQLQELNRQLEGYYMKSSGESVLTVAEQAEFEAIQEEIAELNATVEAETRDWARTSSIILVVFATLVMSISLIKGEQLKVLSNGLLLGGIFTMVYGAGWAVFSGSSPIRLAVIAFALVVTIGLGYLKFVRSRKDVKHDATGQEQQLAAEQGLSSPEGTELLQRIAAIEERLDAAAAAFGSKPSGDRK